MRRIRSLALCITWVVLIGLITAPAASAQGPGSLDAAFDFDGKAYSPRALRSGEIGGMVIQSNGKIVVAGTSFMPGSDQRNFALIRHNADGSIDTSFGVDGIVQVPFDAPYGGFVTDVALQSDGIVAVGFTGSQAEILRMNADGIPDPGFGADGKVAAPEVEIQSVLIEPDDDIVVAGVAGSALQSTSDFMIARYTSAGTLDPTFAGDGVAVVPVSPKLDEAFAVGRLSDGSIVAAGRSVGADNLDFAVVRVSDTGVPDTTFGGDGIVTTPIGTGQDRAYALAVQPDDAIVVGGRSVDGDNDFALARYLTDGSLDPAFDTDGITTTDILGRYESIDGLAVLGDGRIVAAGGAYDAEEPVRQVVMTYSSTGSLDPAFGTGGVAAGLRGSGAAEALAIDADGRVLVAAAISDNLKGTRWVTSRLTDAASSDTPTALKVVAPTKVERGDRFVVQGKLTSADPGCRARQEIALGRPYPELRRDTAADGSFRFKLPADVGKWRNRMNITVEYEGTSTCQRPEVQMFSVRLV